MSRNTVLKVSAAAGVDFCLRIRSSDIYLCNVVGRSMLPRRIHRHEPAAILIVVTLARLK